MKHKPTFIGATVGAISGVLIRPFAVFLYCIQYSDKMLDLSAAQIVMGLIPSAFVGLVTGAIAGSLSNVKVSSVAGSMLSGAAFAAWSNGPLELWVIDIRFQWSIFSYFIIAGAIYGAFGGWAGSKR